MKSCSDHGQSVSTASKSDLESEIEPFLEAAIEGAMDFSRRMHAADVVEILGTPDCWCLVDGDITSVRNMNDEELRQAVVEDLLNVRYWEKQGKPMVFSAFDLLRHLPEDLHAHVQRAFSDPFVQSLLENRRDDEIRICPQHLQDAMDFAGVWHDDFEILTDGVVYVSGP